MIARRAVLLALPSALIACTGPLPEVQERDWQGHFPSLRRAAILVDTGQRRLAFWAADNAAYAEYPIGIARADDMLRKGRTQVVRKVENPSWAPTPAIRKRNPRLPAVVPAGPNNPMGKYALYLGWKYYAIHGTNDPATVGRRSTSGCFRLLDAHITALYAAVPIGAQVLVI